MTRFPPDRATERERTDAARDQLVKQLVAAERAKVDAKSAKLKELRLAKEAAEKESAAATPPPRKTSKPKRAKIGSESN